MSEAASAPVPVVAPVPGAPAPEGQPQQPVQTPEEQYHEIKANGQVRRLSTKEALAYAQLGIGAQEKFQASAQKEKEVAATVQMFKKDFIGAAKQLGYSDEQIVQQMEEYLYKNVIQPSTLSPEQLELQQFREQAKLREEESKSQAQRDAEARENHATQQEAVRLQTEIMQAIDKSGLPKTRFTVSRYVFWAQQNLKGGYDAPPEVILQQVKEEESGIARHACTNRSGKQLVDYLGEEIVKKIRDYDLEQLKARFGDDSAQPTPYRAKPGRAKRSMNDVQEYLNNMRR